jgi:hypothetical protein
MTPAVTYFASDRHALFVGWVLGIALRNAVPLEPVIDDAGNYTDRLRLTLETGDYTDRPPITITVLVPEPPDDWTLE